MTTDVLESLRVQILEAKPGDTVFLVSERPLTAEQALRIKDQVDGLLPDGVRCVVSDGIHVDKVVRP